MLRAESDQLESSQTKSNNIRSIHKQTVFPQGTGLFTSNRPLHKQTVSSRANGGIGKQTASLQANGSAAESLPGAGWGVAVAETGVAWGVRGRLGMPGSAGPTQATCYHTPGMPHVRTTARGFEPLRAEPNGFLVHHLNHSVTLSVAPCQKSS